MGEEAALGFVAALRGAGVVVPVGSSLLYARALAEVGPDPSSLYWAGRATLVHGPEQAAVYDRVFEAYWLGRRIPPTEPGPTEELTLAFDDPDAEVPPDEDGEQVDGDVLAVRFSAREVLRDKDFALLDADELDEVRRLMADLRLVGARRRSRRLTPSRRRRGRPDLASTVRAALRTGGEPVRPRYRAAGRTSPSPGAARRHLAGRWSPTAGPCCASCTPTSAAGTRVEAFTLGTRLTRLTRELATRDPDTAAGQRRRRGGRLVRRDPAGGGAAPVQRHVGRPGHGEGRGGGRSSPTGGTGATPRSSPSRWRGCTGWRSAWCG